MCHKTLYDILEISKYSSIEEIKKAYKCLALRYHPDRNTDESSQKMFVEITDAYNVLSDHEKKWEYDIYIGLGIDYELIHSQFDESIHDHFSEYEMPQGWQHDEIPGTDTNVELLITLEESASGCIKDVITISDINITCTECNGLRHATGSRNIPCIVCCGSGKVINLNKKPSVIEIMCPSCHGFGKNPIILCDVCNGSGSICDEKKVKVRIPEGIDSGYKLRLNGMGLPGKNSVPGDLYVIVNIIKHDIFSRKGKDIYLDHKVDFSTIMYGGSTMIPTLNGTLMEIEIPNGTEPGKTVIQICGSGIKDMSKNVYGDMYVKIQISLPRISTARAEKLLNELIYETSLNHTSNL